MACTPAVPANNVQIIESRPAGLMQVPLTIRSASGEHRFTVEVAASLEEQNAGLMYRRSLGPDRGMIFPYDPPQPVAFWMKNTLIPLDMIFIRADGSIARIAANTVPLSLEPVPAGEPIAAVLEIRGGRAAELGIRQGDIVDWRHRPPCCKKAGPKTPAAGKVNPGGPPMNTPPPPLPPERGR